jgi:glycosyltransferase involved in cell wall biosynthesis
LKGIRGATFAIVANGFGGGPSEALQEFLLAEGAKRITVVLHPLVDEGDTRHLISVHESGSTAETRRIRLPFRPPYTYPLDLAVPLRVGHVDGWFGFNSLACARGLAARAARRAERVVYWCVDFVPDRFGTGVVTCAYDRLDRLCCRRADARFELSAAALDGRNRRHGFSYAEVAPARVVPMGAWLDRVPTTPPDGHARRRVVYLGHLVPRQGVRLLIETLALLRGRVEANIVGRGPLEEELRRSAAAHGLADSVVFHGFVEDHREVEAILANASVAVAPYATDDATFSRFADPGKLKAYLAAGLPIAITDVPPNARELAERGGAELVDYSADTLAAAIERLLADPADWQRRRDAALALAREFDWPRILEPALESIGFVAG